MVASFGNLPADLRRMIWGIAATNDFKGRVIECAWHGTAYYQRTTRRINTQRRSERAGLRWNNRLEAVSAPLGTLAANHESRAVTIIHIRTICN